MTTSSKRSALLGVGIVVMIVGLLSAIGLWYSAGQLESDAIRNLARAPSGCDTTLDFEAAGDFTIYVETAGRFDAPIAGDCVAEGEYGIVGDVVPAVSLVMTSPTGDAVELANASGTTYDADGFSGQSVRTFSVETPGDHVLRVELPGDTDVQVAVAIGRDPSDGVAMMQLGAVLAGLAGVLIGGGLIIAARRSAAAEPAAVVTEPWTADPAAWATTPPGMPQAPPTEGWQPAVGPPTHAPGVTSPQQPAAWPPQPAAPGPVPAPPPDGASGDGEQSPWAPPSNPAG